MAPEPSRSELSSYRVTLFFGPETIEQRSDEVACVFNVKKRSWKMGIQVSVELYASQLSSLRETIRLGDRLAPAFSTLETLARPDYEARAADLFAQVVSWCKLDLLLEAGLPPENQRLLASHFMPELDRAIISRVAYVVTYILTQLDLVPDPASPSQ